MGVVDESVEDGIGEGGVCDGFVPVVEGDLGGDEGGACLVSVFDYLEEVSAVLVRRFWRREQQRLQRPVIQLGRQRPRKPRLLGFKTAPKRLRIPLKVIPRR